MSDFIAFVVGFFCAILLVIIYVPTPREAVEDYLNNPEKYKIMTIVQVTPEGDTLKATYKVIEMQK